MGERNLLWEDTVGENTQILMYFQHEFKTASARWCFMYINQRVHVDVFEHILRFLKISISEKSEDDNVEAEISVGKSGLWNLRVYAEIHVFKISFKPDFRAFYSNPVFFNVLISAVLQCILTSVWSSVMLSVHWLYVWDYLPLHTKQCIWDYS